jgi:hypothetical protein
VAAWVTIARSESRGGPSTEAVGAPDRRRAASNRKEVIMQHNQPFVANKDAATFAQAIVDTVREPLLVLDKELRVLAASRSFYLTFKVAKANTQGRLL